MYGESVKKRDKIIESAGYEFANKGYRKASTAEICKRAGVSKGLLFHFYNSKKELYAGILRKCVQEYKDFISGITFTNCNTYYEVVVKIAREKAEYIAKYPIASSILTEALHNTPDEIMNEIEDIVLDYEKMRKTYLNEINERFDFRVGVDKAKALELIELVNGFVTKKFQIIINEKSFLITEKYDEFLKLSESMLEYYELVFNGIEGNAKV